MSQADPAPPTARAEGAAPVRRSALRLLRTAAISAGCAWLVLTYAGQVFHIQGSSMTPALGSGERVLVEKLALHFRDARRGEVVVFRDPADVSRAILVKRVVGIPGDTVRFLGDEIAVRAARGTGLRPCSGAEVGATRFGSSGPGALEVVLGADEYFVVGDNRARSSDSRHWGPLPRARIVGTARWRVFPPGRIGRIDPAVAQASGPCAHGSG